MSSDRPYREAVAVEGRSGSLLGSYRRGGLLAGIAARLRPGQENPLVRLLVTQIDAFARAVRNPSQVSPLATAADGFAVMAALHAVRRSAAEGGAMVEVISRRPSGGGTPS